MEKDLAGKPMKMPVVLPLIIKGMLDINTPWRDLAIRLGRIPGDDGRKHWQEMCAKHNIQIECWFPLGGRESKGELLRDPVINEIAKAHGKSAAQIIIRWHLQEGFSVIPGSSNPRHIQENIEVFDFALSNYDMFRIHQLDKEKRYFNMPYEDQKKWFMQWNPTD